MAFKQVRERPNHCVTAQCRGWSSVPACALVDSSAHCPSFVLLLFFRFTTVILLDYDDTLLCSSFLAAHQIRLDSVLPDLSVPLCPLSASAADKAAREVALQLRELEQCVHQLLVNAINHSQRTIVVTNAGEFF